MGYCSKGTVLASILMLGTMGIANAATASINNSNEIKLSSAHIRADYVEVERLKQTKDVIVLRKEDIQGKGYKTLNDVLNSIPSINVGMSGYGSIDIRGQGSAMASRNIQVLLDGSPITTLTEHPMMNDYNYIPVANIEKIEIVAGGGSVMYGSGTAGGVINITTNLKQMDKNNNSIFGTWGTQSKVGGINYGAKVSDKFNFNVSYTKDNKDQYFKNTYKNTEYGALGFAYKPDDSQRIIVRASKMRTDGQFIPSLNKGNFEKYGREYVPRSSSITIGLDENGKKIKIKAPGYLDADRSLNSYSLNYAKNFSSNDRLSVDAFYNTGYFTNNNFGNTMNQDTKGIKTKFDHKYGENKEHSVLFGLDWTRQNAQLAYDDYKYDRTSGTYYKHPLHFFYTKDVKAGYVSNNLTYGKWKLVQGARYEFANWSYDKEEAKCSGADTRKEKDLGLELAASYQYNDLGDVYARYEKGFTHPTGVQMADSNGSEISPSIVNDEKYDLYEIGIRDKIGVSTVKLVGFYSVTDNQIDRFLKFDKNGLSRFSRNVYNTKRHGAELTLGQNLGKWKLKEGCTYLSNSEDLSAYGRKMQANDGKFKNWERQTLKAVPKHKAVLQATYSPDDRWALTGKYTYVGKYNTQTEVGTHKVVDFDTRLQANDQVTIHAGIKNVFDEKYFATYNSYYGLFPGDSREYYLTCNYSF